MKALHILLAFLLLPAYGFGQSAVCIYKDSKNAVGDYMLVYGVPTAEEALILAQRKLSYLTQAGIAQSACVSTDKSGFGMVLKGEVSTSAGNMAVFGASLGCSTPEEAEALAIKDLKHRNPEWDGKKHKVVERFQDKGANVIK